MQYEWYLIRCCCDKQWSFYIGILSKNLPILAYWNNWNDTHAYENIPIKFKSVSAQEKDNLLWDKLNKQASRNLQRYFYSTKINYKCK